MGCAQLTRVGQPIGQHKPAFGVGVNDFDGFSRLIGGKRHRGLHVAGFLRGAGGHVFRGANDGDHAHARLEQRDGAHCADHRRAAGHVVLHLLHIVAGLEGDAAGVEGDSLPYQAEHRAFAYAFGLIAQHDQGGRFGGALRDAPECAHLQLVQLFGGVDLPAEADFGSHQRGALAEEGGGELVARLVDQ